MRTVGKPPAGKGYLQYHSMNIRLQKIWYVLGIWLVPVALVLIESLFFLNKATENSHYVPYFVTFWIARALLSPLIVLYTLHFWINSRPLRVFGIHAVGFLLFSIAFWLLAYFVLHPLLYKNEFFGTSQTSTNMQVFSMIADNSISTNSIVYISTVAFCYIREYLQQNLSIHKKAMALEKSLLVSRLELLKGQLNTHFLFNTLHSISSLVVRQQNDEANKMLVQLSELLRFALRDNKEQLIPLKKEIEMLRIYIGIQQTRFKERLSVEFLFEEDFDTVLLPPLILQPLLENAIRYAVEPYKGVGVIKIQIRRVDNKLCITIKDNGKTKFEMINFNSGIGLQNTKERLHQLFGHNHVFQILSNQPDEGVSIHMEIPFQTFKYTTDESAYS